MPSSYSPNLRIELIASGEQANTWGNTTNTNLGTLIEQAICGYVSLNSMTDANYTLTALNGASDQARQMFVDVPAGTTLSATRFIIAPAVSKVYVVRNLTTGGQSVTIATATTGVTGVTIPNGRIKMVACDGTNFTEVTTSLNKLYLETAIDYATSAANQAVTKTYVDSGFLRLAGNNTVTGNTTFSGTVTLPSTTPTGYQATSFSYVNSNYLWKASGGPATQDVYPYLRLQYTPVNAADAVPKTYVDSNFVSLFDPQTIAGVKTFTSNMALSGAGVQLTLPNAPVSGTDAVNKSYVDGATSNFMTVSGAAQTNITSAKTFNNTVSIGSGYQLYLPSGDGTAGANYAINRGYVDYVISVLTPTVVTTNTTQSISGAKTFTTGVVLSGATTQLTLPNDPVASTDAARRGWIISNYVDINSTQNVTGIKTFPNGLSMGASGQIYLPSSPAGSLYAANQAYVDGEIAYLASQGVPNTRTISAGSTNVYINGVAGGSATLASNITIDVSSVTVPVTGVGGTSPVKANGVSGSYQTGNINISMDVASSSTNGYLSATDWTTFNNKANANGSNASGTWGISITGGAGSASTVPWSGLTGSPPSNSIFANGAGYQTAAQVTSAITSYGYQTAAQVSSAISSGTANNANNLGGVTASGYMRSDVAATGTSYVTFSRSGTSFTSTLGVLYDATFGATGYAAGINAYTPSASAGNYAPVGLVQTNASGSAPFLALVAGTSGRISMQSLSGYGVVNPYADNSGLLYSYNPSDVSLKENIEEYDGGLIAVLALNPVHYDWIDKERFGDRHQIGLIAQEVDPIVPEVVQKNREDDVWGVDYVKLIPVLISAVQELNAKVEAQAAEIAALKGA